MESIANMRVLVTGGAGFIGYNLSSRGSVERMRKLRSLKIPTVVADIRHRHRITEITKGADLVFHLAAMASVPLSVERPQYDCQVNVIGTVNVFEAARAIDAKVVFASSSAVYGNPHQIPIPETHELQPISFYGLTKVVDELYCRAYYETHQLRVTALRLFNVYGPEAKMGVTYDFLKKLSIDNSRLEVIGDGEQTKDFIYVDDTVEAFIAAAETERADGEAYNIGSGENLKIRDLAQKTVDRLDLHETTEILYGVTPTWIGDVKYTKADLRKASSELGWRPKTDHDEGLDRTIRWFESTHGEIGN